MGMQEAEVNLTIYEIVLGLDDYLQIIKKPMDLKTVRKNLGRGKYKRYRDFFADLQLIWDNCKTYNQADSEIHQDAVYLEKLSNRCIKKFRYEVQLRRFSSDKSDPASDSESDIESDMQANQNEASHAMYRVSFERKLSFTESMRQLTNNSLTKVIQKIRELSPKVLEDVEGSRLHIKIDDIDKKTFEALEAFVKQHVKSSCSAISAPPTSLKADGDVDMKE